MNACMYVCVLAYLSINQSINQSINPADVSPILEVILTYGILYCIFILCVYEVNADYDTSSVHHKTMVLYARKCI